MSTIVIIYLLMADCVPCLNRKFTCCFSSEKFSQIKRRMCGFIRLTRERFRQFWWFLASYPRKRCVAGHNGKVWSIKQFLQQDGWHAIAHCLKQYTIAQGTWGVTCENVAFIEPDMWLPTVRI